MMEKPTILAVDDEKGVREFFSIALSDRYNLLLAETGAESLEILRKNSAEIVLLDIRLPDIDGMEILRQVKELEPATEVIMVTAVREVSTAVKAIKLGAHDYISKPVNVEELLTIIEKALEKGSLVREVTYLRSELQRYQAFEKMVGKNEKIRQIFHLISGIADSDASVLIQGESGTGKELVARAIHNRSPRRDNPFVVLTCAAIPQNLMESHIFGHTKGAFTDAKTTTAGKLEIANKGTVLLDDVDTLDVGMQAKLLRVIQEKEFERLGSNKIVRLDVRFLASSNKDLQALIAKGDFREDLYYRLNVFPITVPALRDRQEDIPLLVDYFLKRYSERTGKPPKRIAKKAMDALQRYNWPGNVRELENLIERLCTVGRKEVIYTQDIFSPSIGLKRFRDMRLEDALKAFEKKYICEVLEQENWSRKRTAKVLGIHRNTLRLKMRELGIQTK